MPNHTLNTLTFSGDSARIEALLAAVQNDEGGKGSIDFDRLIPMPEELNPERNPQETPNEMCFNFPAWYDWRIEHWGTKWNAYDGQEVELLQGGDIRMTFHTAWNPPHPIVAKLSQQFPDIQILHEWADEDPCGYHGSRTYMNGVCTDSFEPEETADKLRFYTLLMCEDPEMTKEE